jgi:hypothetical protein
MRAVREAVRVVEEGVTVGRYVVEERQQLYRLKVQDEERRQEAERLFRVQQVSVCCCLVHRCLGFVQRLIVSYFTLSIISIV